MNSLIVLVHIVTMVISMACMSGALLLGLYGNALAVRAATMGVAATLFGFVSGLLLLVDTPLSLKCAGLTAYVLGVSILYYFGYGLGDVKKARLVRDTA